MQGWGISAVEIRLLKTYVALVAFGLLLARPPASAAPFTPSMLMRVCTSNNELDRANCEAFYRGAIERFEARSDFLRACRHSPFTRDDLNAFVSYGGEHMIPDTNEGFSLIVRYLASAGGLGEHVPCKDVPGYWTTSHYLDLCSQNMAGDSPCKFYSLPLLEAASLEPALSGRRIFCPLGDPVRGDQEVVQKFRAWLTDHPERADGPAALGFIDAMQASYPCPR